MRGQYMGRPTSQKVMCVATYRLRVALSQAPGTRERDAENSNAFVSIGKLGVCCRHLHGKPATLHR